VITFKCVDCLNTHPEPKAAKLCCDNNLGEKTMPRARNNGSPKTTKKKTTKKKPVGFVKRKSPKKTKMA